MDAVDSYVPEPERDLDKPFLMPIEDVFTITGSGTVVTGKVEQGIVRVDEVEIVGIRPTQDHLHGGGDVPRLLDQGQAGDNIGVLLQGTKKEESSAARCWPSPVRSRRTPTGAQVYVLTKEEGRHKPFFTTTSPSSTSGPPTSPAPSSSPTGSRCACPATTPR